MDIDNKGLDFTDKRVLMAMIEKFGGGPVGLDTLSATTNEEISTIEEADIILFLYDLTQGMSNDDKEIFDLIKDAIFSCRQLDFEYFAPMQNCQTRSVQPWKIIFRGQAWYLLAFCNQKQSPRYFKLSRIQKPKISQKPITQFFSAEMLRQNDESPVNRPLKTVRVKVQIENYALSNLLDDVPNAEILEQRENFSIVQFDFVDEDNGIVYNESNTYENVQKTFGLADETMKYLLQYLYGNELLEKLMNGVKNGK